LVKNGYSQEEGVDYENTSSPMDNMASIRLLLAFKVATRGLEVKQMDVKTMFLQDALKEEIFIK
jgi:hypothetical protein